MRVEVTFSFEIEDEIAFLAQANAKCKAEWGSTLSEVTAPYPDQSLSDALLVQAVVETFIASNGERWPDGTASDADLDYSGRVNRSSNPVRILTGNQERSHDV